MIEFALGCLAGLAVGFLLPAVLSVFEADVYSRVPLPPRPTAPLPPPIPPATWTVRSWPAVGVRRIGGPTKSLFPLTKDRRPSRQEDPNG